MKLNDLLEAEWHEASEGSLINKISMDHSYLPDLIKAGANITDNVIEFAMDHAGPNYTIRTILRTKKPDGSLIPISDRILDKIMNHTAAIAALGHYNYKFTPERLKQVLSNSDFITLRPEAYTEFVQQYFKDNTILMNKWLRYAENVRDLK
jgi:hypothetical protein